MSFNIFSKKTNDYEKKSFYYSTSQLSNWSSNINYTYLENVYQTNPLVFRCIHMINQCIGSMKITCKNNRAIETYLNCHFPEIISRLFIYGNCFVNKNLDLLPINKITIIKNLEDNKVQKYKIGDRLYESEEILHLKYTINPSGSYSISPIQVCSRWIDIYKYIQDYIGTMMKYGGKPSGILSYNNMLNEKDRTSLKDQFKELYKNVSNGGTIILTNSSISWQPIAMEPEKLCLLNHMKQATQEIASCFGVPSILLNVSENVTYTNYREARNQFWDDTLTPFIVNILETLSLFLQEDITIDTRYNGKLDGQI